MESGEDTLPLVGKPFAVLDLETLNKSKEIQSPHKRPTKFFQRVPTPVGKNDGAQK